MVPLLVPWWSFISFSDGWNSMGVHRTRGRLKESIRNCDSKLRSNLHAEELAVGPTVGGSKYRFYPIYIEAVIILRRRVRSIRVGSQTLKLEKSLPVRSRKTRRNAKSRGFVEESHCLCFPRICPSRRTWRE